VNLETLSPNELQALIADAPSKMKAARANLIQDVRKKMDALLSISGVTLAEVYPTRGGKKAGGKKGNTSSVAPKYRDPSDPSKTWSGRGRKPSWFVDALKRWGVIAESLLIAGAPRQRRPPRRRQRTLPRRLPRAGQRRQPSQRARRPSQTSNFPLAYPTKAPLISAGLFAFRSAAGGI